MKGLFIGIFVLLAAVPSWACDLLSRVYTDGYYLMTFNPPAEDFGHGIFIDITDPIEGRIFEGVQGFGNGIAYPQVGFCAKGQAQNQNCVYQGTVYTIDAEKTKMGFRENEHLPLLFPKLGVDFYYKSDLRNKGLDVKIPKDLWVFKECKK